MTRGQVIYITQLTAGLPSVGAYDINTLQPVDVGSALTTNRAVGNGHFYGGLSTDSSGNVYVAAPDGYLYKYDNTGAVVTAFGSNGSVYAGYNSIVTGSAVNPAGTQVLLPFNANASAAYAYNTATGAPVGGFTAATVASGSPWAVAFNPSGTYFYASNGSNSLERFSLTGGSGSAITFTSSPLNNGIEYAKGMVFESDTSLVVTDLAQGFLVRYTLSGLTASLDTTFGSGGYLSISGLTSGVALDGSGNLYVLTDNGTNSYIQKYTANGALINGTFLSLPTSGGYATYRGGLAIDFASIPEPQTYLLLSSGLGLVGLARFRRRHG